MAETRETITVKITPELNHWKQALESILEAVRRRSELEQAMEAVTATFADSPERESPGDRSLSDSTAVEAVPGLMRIFGTGEDMRSARDELGNPGALNEALVATGIDAFFWLLGGGDIELEGKRFRLVPVGGED